MFYLVDWLQANLLMLFTTLCLISIPAVILIVAFRKYSGPNADKDAFEKQKEK